MRLRACRPRLEGARRGRRLARAREGRAARPRRRRVEGARAARLGAESRLRGARPRCSWTPISSASGGARAHRKPPIADVSGARAHAASRRRSVDRVRRAVVARRTRGWAPHSRLFIGQEAAEWVLVVRGAPARAHRVARSASSSGRRSGSTRWRASRSSTRASSRFSSTTSSVEATTSASRTSTAGPARRGCRSSTRASRRCAGVMRRSTASR